MAGRDESVGDAEIALQRVFIGRHDKSQILLGLRGAGKTVLLNRIELLAEERGHLTALIEAPEGRPLASLLYPKVHQVLRKLSGVETAKARAHAAMRALRGFSSAFKLSVGDVSLSVDPEPGIADSGDLFIRIGEAAQSAGKGWTLLIDEVQYLSKAELAALIVAMHRINQKGLPVMFFGAGLPQVAALSGNAKSYAERLFNYPHVGALDAASTIAAIRQPIMDEGESISDAAIERIADLTRSYPYFLQEWAYQSWNAARGSPIDGRDVDQASGAAFRRLDDGFFRVRFDRLTPKEREYVFAMARLGGAPYRSADVADDLGESVQALGPRRAKIISKGMIYSPAHGDIAFTVPMFETYLQRIASERPGAIKRS